MRPSELLQADAEARAAALSVERSFIVQAPAGSGKTELLTQRFLALLAVVESPEALLAITFTRKAAAEMRSRILEALRSCTSDASDLRDETRALARRVLSVDMSRGWNLLQNPARLRVLTIDALNQSLARRLPVLSGLGAGLDVAESGRMLYELAAERLLSQLPSEDPRIAEALGILLEHLDNRVDKFVKLVAQMLARREAWLPVLPVDVEAYGEAGAVRRELEAGRAGVVGAHLESLRDAFPPHLLQEFCSFAQGASAVLRGGGEQDSPMLACGPGVPGTGTEHVAHWQGLAHFLLTKDGTPRRSFNSSVGVRKAEKQRPELAELKQRITDAVAGLNQHEALCGLLGATRDLPPVRYSATEWQVLKSLLLLLRLAAVELKVVFAERNTADYPEFAAAARQALGTDEEPTDTALALDAQLHHILVDEFQDTSEAQVELLKGLTAGWQPGDGRTLFLVGDPMQSIYRFRNAEVGLFLQVRDRGLGSLRLEPLTLRVNFRSTQPLVRWVNDCFGRVLPPRDDVLLGAVRFAASVARPGAADDGAVSVHAFLRRSRKLEAQTVADLVQRRLAEFASQDNATGAGPGRARIGILVQGRSHLIDIVAELARRRIPFHATDIDPLGERPAVLDLLALTRALAHLADRAAWLGVLRAPWCGLTLAELHTLVGDDRDAAVLRLLRDEARRARLERPARERLERCLPVLESALDELRRLGIRDTVERAWIALGGPATLHDERELDEARAYLDALSTVEAEAPGASADLVRLAEALRELYAPAKPHPDTRVEMLTIHKSKGLQFDTVIVPGLERRGRGDEPQLLQWLEAPGRGPHGLIIAPMAETGAAQPDLLYGWLVRLEREKQLHERRRLLYVAATRAEHSLHLLGTCAVEIDKDTQEPRLRTPDAVTALGHLWVVPTVRTAFELRLAAAGAIDGEDVPRIPRDPLIERLPEGWQRPAVPPAPTLEIRDLRRMAVTAPVQFDWATETARHVGTLVHRELQRLARSEVAPAGVTEAALRRLEAELAELGVPGERREAAARRVLDAVQRTLQDERGRWLLQAEHREAQAEVGLTGVIERDVVSVVIDRTFVDAEGVRWIVDYKTSSHEGAGIDEFLDQERERYRPQLERYAQLLRPLGAGPIRLALYFPLLSAWREWPAAEA